MYVLRPTKPQALHGKASRGNLTSIHNVCVCVCVAARRYYDRAVYRRNRFRYPDDDNNAATRVFLYIYSFDK